MLDPKTTNRVPREPLVLDKTWQIRCFHMLSQLRAMELEAKGLRFRKSVYAHVKREYKLNGNRRAVIIQLQKKLNDLEAEHGVEPTPLRPE